MNSRPPPSAAHLLTPPISLAPRPPPPPLPRKHTLTHPPHRYSTGRGGACGLWTNFWGPESSFGWDYHCGNVTDGGWEEVDELMQSIGQLNMPVGLMFDTQQLPNVAAWKLNLDPAQRTNGAAVVNVWMTQGWCMYTPTNSAHHTPPPTDPASIAARTLNPEQLIICST